MKKAILISVLFFFFINLLCAVEINIEKEEYYPAETLTAVIQGNFPFGLSKENIAIYQGDKVHPTPAEADLLKRSNEYLYYAVLPREAGNYSIKIINTDHYVGSVLSTEEIIKKFIISETNSSYLSISPGFISTTEDFSIKVKAINSAQEGEAVFKETGESHNFTLVEEQEKTISFSVDDLNETVSSYVEVDGFKISIFFYRQNIEENPLNIEEALRLSFEDLEVTIKKQEPYSFLLRISNIANETIGPINLSASFDEGIDISPSFIREIEKNEEEIVNITLELEENTEEYVRVTMSNQSIDIEMKIRVTEDEAEVTINQTPSTQTCSELRGNICSENETCSNTQRFSNDGVCCLGQCIGPAKSSKWFWIGLLGLVLVIGIWGLFNKIRERPSESSFKEAFEKKSREAMERIKHQNREEVRGDLSKS